MGLTNRAKFPRWQAIAALDISTEVSLFTFCIALVWGLQMRISHKIVIMVSFAARLPYVTLPLPTCSSQAPFHETNADLTDRLIIFSALHLSTLKEYTTTENPTLTAISHTVFTQLHLNYALIACTVFCLRPFMNALTTYYGTAGDSNLGSSGGYGYVYGSGGRNTDPYASGRSRDYEMGRLKGRPGRRVSGLFRERPDVGDGTENGTVVCEAAGPAHSPGVRSEGEGDSTRSGSDGSTRMIIRKEVEYSVSLGHS